MTVTAVHYVINDYDGDYMCDPYTGLMYNIETPYNNSSIKLFTTIMVLTWNDHL